MVILKLAFYVHLSRLHNRHLGGVGNRTWIFRRMVSQDVFITIDTAYQNLQYAVS